MSCPQAKAHQALHEVPRRLFSCFSMGGGGDSEWVWVCVSISSSALPVIFLEGTHSMLALLGHLLMLCLLSVILSLLGFGPQTWECSLHAWGL